MHNYRYYIFDLYSNKFSRTKIIVLHEYGRQSIDINITPSGDMICIYKRHVGEYNAQSNGYAYEYYVPTYMYLKFDVYNKDKKYYNCIIAEHHSFR